MYSEKAYHIADNCRFCWMCRHVCPVGLVTGREINTPRAKGLLVSMEKRGFPMKKDSAGAYYECMLCGSCSNDCATGFEPPVMIREARTQAAANGLMPEAAEQVLNRILKTGTMYTQEEPEELRLAVKRHQGNAPVLLLPGATARCRTPQMALALIWLLEKAGVEFSVPECEPATGSELYDLVGAVEETRQQAKACSRMLSQTGTKTIVVMDSYLAETIKHQYPVWDCALDADVRTATSCVAELIEQGRLTPGSLGLTVTVHDSPRLARDLEETEPVRAILKAAGCQIQEMFLNRALTRCCGSALFAQYAPDMAVLTGRGRLSDAERTGAQVLVAECPQALDLFTMAAGAGTDKPEIRDIFSLLRDAVAMGNREG